MEDKFNKKLFRKLRSKDRVIVRDGETRREIYGASLDDLRRYLGGHFTPRRILDEEKEERVRSDNSLTNKLDEVESSITPAIEEALENADFYTTEEINAIETALNNAIDGKVGLGETYQNVQVTEENGLLVIGYDGEDPVARINLRGSGETSDGDSYAGIHIQKNEGTASVEDWVSKFWADTDGNLFLKGNVQLDDGSILVGNTTEGVFVDSELGLLVQSTDVRVVLNSTGTDDDGNEYAGLSILSRDGEDWIANLYADADGNIFARGEIIVTSGKVLGPLSVGDPTIVVIDPDGTPPATETVDESTALGEFFTQYSLSEPGGPNAGAPFSTDMGLSVHADMNFDLSEVEQGSDVVHVILQGRYPDEEWVDVTTRVYNNNSGEQFTANDSFIGSTGHPEWRLVLRGFTSSGNTNRFTVTSVDWTSSTITTAITSKGIMQRRADGLVYALTGSPGSSGSSGGGEGISDWTSIIGKPSNESAWAAETGFDDRYFDQDNLLSEVDPGDISTLLDNITLGATDDVEFRDITGRNGTFSDLLRGETLRTDTGKILAPVDLQVRNAGDTDYRKISIKQATEADHAVAAARSITLNPDGDGVVSWDHGAQNLTSNRSWTPTIADHGEDQRGVLSLGQQDIYGEKGFRNDTTFHAAAILKDAAALRSEEYIGGFAGEGVRLHRDENGHWNLTVDNVSARRRFTVYELMRQGMKFGRGDEIFRSGMTAVDVIERPAYRTESEITETHAEADFLEGVSHEIYGEEDLFIPLSDNDLIRQQIFSGRNVKLMEASVVAVENGEETVTDNSTPRYASINLASGSDEPSSGDEWVAYGNRFDPNRQGFVGIFGEDEGAPFMRIMNGITSREKFGSMETMVGQYGRLDNIVDPDFDDLDGTQQNLYGSYTINGYFKGKLVVAPGSTGAGNFIDLPSNDDIAEVFGWENYENMLSDALTTGQTLIQGGFVRTSLIDVQDLWSVNATVTGIFTLGSGGEFESNVLTFGRNNFELDANNLLVTSSFGGLVEVGDVFMARGDNNTGTIAGFSFNGLEFSASGMLIRGGSSPRIELGSNGTIALPGVGALNQDGLLLSSSQHILFGPISGGISGGLDWNDGLRLWTDLSRNVILDGADRIGEDNLNGTIVNGSLNATFGLIKGDIQETDTLSGGPYNLSISRKGSVCRVILGDNININTLDYVGGHSPGQGDFKILANTSSTYSFTLTDAGNPSGISFNRQHTVYPGSFAILLHFTSIGWLIHTDHGQ